MKNVRQTYIYPLDTHLPDGLEDMVLRSLPEIIKPKGGKKNGDASTKVHHRAIRNGGDASQGVSCDAG